MTFNDILAYCRSSYSEKDKGTKFEKIMCAWLKTDPRFNELESVWMWEDFPSRKDFGGKDIGIDLVARTETGDYWAIQCKCYAETTTIDKPAVDSFLSTSAKSFVDPITFQTTRFAHRVWISTTNHWGTNAQQAIEHQNPEVTRINLADLTESKVDWEKLYDGISGKAARLTQKQPMEHQIKAIEAAQKYFIEEQNDRGKLIMACGTGKTYTSLKTVETLLENKGLVLFLVPSISLLGQTLNEWSSDADKPIKAICICSDSTASRNRKQDDDDPTFSAIDLALPASTDPKNISKQLKRYREHDGLVVVFSTYQSIESVYQAQQQILKDTNNQYGIFDFIICDEAHRTTGATKQGEDSNFAKIHEADYIRGNKRLYMTATPRIYSDTTKAQATEKDFILYSMDNEQWYGKEYYHVGFGYAVEHQLLTDYKVFVMTVSESDIPKDIQRAIQNNKNKELSFDDVSKLIGVISGLSKIIKGDDGRTWEIDPRTMRRALAFCSSIGNVSKPGTSKNVAEVLPRISQFYQDLKGVTSEAGEILPEHIVSVETKHVDGSMNSVTRAEALRWLAEEPEIPNECRVITNVRCLSEGVDVPALDAVLFLSARNSQVDIVQSVGRVMRNFRRGTAEEKKYGYIIIPVVIPDGAEPDAILKANDFKTVWSILNALRSHDDRFNAHVNKINLNKKKQDKVVIGQQGLGFGTHGVGQSECSDNNLPEELQIDFGEYENVIYAKLVDKVGDKMYWENWAKEVGVIAQKFIDRIEREIQTGRYKVEFNKYLDALRKNINPYVDEAQAIQMLAQHMITKPVFDALFHNYEFVKNNSISSSMENMLNLLQADAFEKDTEVLRHFYESVERNISDIDNLEGKQTIIKNLYEKFFKGAFPTTVEQLGIVYTPVECVDFIIHSVDSLLRKEFGTSLTEENVHILDPFTGTGTFITRLLQSGLIKDEDLERKYRNEIHCNEIVLLAYYIADVNIEAVFHDLHKTNEYIPYDNICLTDTFQLAESKQTEAKFTEYFRENSENVNRQKGTPIRVIIGNPPYSIGQKSQNDNAQNLKYEHLDSRVDETYAKQSNANLTKALYDSYIKAFRWASDRIPQEEGGVIAFISNGAWLDGNSQDGFRKCLEKEFSSIYVFNLRGNQRTSGELSRKEGGKIFGGGSRTPIAITFLVKNPATHAGKATIHYYDIGDYLSREQKLDIIHGFKSIDGISWATIIPNDKADWINQRDGIFDNLIQVQPNKKFDIKAQAFFNTYAIGVATNRDAWVYGYSKKLISDNVKRCLAFYDEQRADLGSGRITELSSDSNKISWTVNLKKSALDNKQIHYDGDAFLESEYRPYSKMYLYYQKDLIERPGIWKTIFPTAEHKNIVISLSGVGGSKPFSVQIIDKIPSLDYIEKNQCFPLYWYEENKHQSVQLSMFDTESSTDKYIRKDGITDWILKEIRSRFSNSKEITKERIFYYVYGILHSPEYRTRFADDLRKSLPRIPIVERIEDFIMFSKIGKQLTDIHLNYEAVEPTQQVTTKYIAQPPVSNERLKMWFADPDGEQLLEQSYDFYSVEKMRFAKVRDEKNNLVPDKSVILYNNNIRIENIPLEAYDYIVNGKSAIEWIMERYAISVDANSGIRNNPNDWSREHKKPTYILDLLQSIISLSLQTNVLVAQLPKLNL